MAWFFTSLWKAVMVEYIKIRPFFKTVKQSCNWLHMSFASAVSNSFVSRVSLCFIILLYAFFFPWTWAVSPCIRALKKLSSFCQSQALILKKRLKITFGSLLVVCVTDWKWPKVCSRKTYCIYDRKNICMSSFVELITCGVHQGSNCGPMTFTFLQVMVFFPLHERHGPKLNLKTHHTIKWLFSRMTVWQI